MKCIKELAKQVSERRENKAVIVAWTQRVQEIAKQQSRAVECRRGKCPASRTLSKVGHLLKGWGQRVRKLDHGLPIFIKILYSTLNAVGLLIMIWHVSQSSFGCSVENGLYRVEEKRKRQDRRSVKWNMTEARTRVVRGSGDRILSKFLINSIGFPVEFHVWYGQ